MEVQKQHNIVEVFFIDSRNITRSQVLLSYEQIKEVYLIGGDVIVQ